MRNLKRVDVILKVEKEFELDYNYNYEIMKELYNCMSKIDSEFAKEIHDSKKMSLFNFNLYIENAEYKNCIKVKEGFINLTLSGKFDIIEKIVRGIMKDGIIIGKNKLSIMEIKSEKVRLKDTCLYRVRTPIVVSKDSKFIDVYKSEEYFNAIGVNLLKKYKYIYGIDYNGKLFFEIEDIFDINKKMINNVKGGKLVGYTFNIFIEADKDMQYIAHMCGLGERNSMGCGNLKFIKNL
ncbi:MAG: CRISPR-associated endoribonuclease Cas6 [Bacilli bacterium]